MVVLYGRLEVIVIEAKGLPNLDYNIFNPNDKSDPFCIVEIEGASGITPIGKTFTIDDCLNPKWYYRIVHDIRQDIVGLRFRVKDKDYISSDLIGSTFLPVYEFINGSEFNGALSLTSPKGRPAGHLIINVKYSGTESSDVKLSFEDKVLPTAAKIAKGVGRIFPRGTSGCSTESFSSYEMGMFLHGYLDIVIERAVDLPNLDSSLLSFSKKDVSDPYVVVTLEDREGGSWKVATTGVKDNNLNPIWMENFRVDICHHVTSVTFGVRDKDFVSSELIGAVTFTAESILEANGIRGMFDMFRENGSKKAGQLGLSIMYRPKCEASVCTEVPECLFPMKHRNHVNLYHDAHNPNVSVPFSDVSGGTYFPRSAWLDMYNTFANAKKFIYIVGWSVSAKIRLLRWEGQDHSTLGELLVKKANEGVRVRLLLWDELTSNDLKKTGAMSTEDEETATFFKGSRVVVVLAPRDRYTKNIFSTKNPFTKLCYTHHQKCIIADAPVDEISCQRKIVAFVGGLDLTGGRFDTPEHPLFRTLVADHKDDFRNRMHPTTSNSGPREPWHDIHCMVEGPVALDVLQNFLERWDKQGDGDDNIAPLQNDGDIKFDYCCEGDDQWNVQLFRSINSDSAIFNWQTSLSKGLANKKGRAFDNSLHRAYIHQIRKAKKFMYFENQYFLGSSHAWYDCRDARAGNLVPLEITARIEEKIRLGERFMVYIVIPMFPEGKPADKVTQEILHWQFRTMQMMYRRIADCIAEVSSDAHPQDYLMFFCLGNKESYDTVPPELIVPEDPSAALAFQNRRLMIYVHSKMAVFDDEYIIVGSANINDRSLSGNRDTEIAIGASQPSFMADGDHLPRGQVGLFRRSLWAEHMGEQAPIEEHPSSLSCIRKVRKLAEEALVSYISNDGIKIPRHLLIYPLTVHQDGVLTARADCPAIPDTQASFMGARSKVFPSSLTT